MKTALPKIMKAVNDAFPGIVFTPDFEVLTIPRAPSFDEAESWGRSYGSYGKQIFTRTPVVDVIKVRFKYLTTGTVEIAQLLKTDNSYTKTLKDTLRSIESGNDYESYLDWKITISFNGEQANDLNLAQFSFTCSPEYDNLRNLITKEVDKRAAEEANKAKETFERIEKFRRLAKM